MSQRRDLSIARNEIAMAQKAINELRGNYASDDAAEIWREFLYRLQRAVNKVRGHFVTNQKFKSWDGVKQKEIANDPWLQYLLQSRNAEEHRIEVLGDAQE
jgi:hypothetical protein